MSGGSGSSVRPVSSAPLGHIARGPRYTTDTMNHALAALSLAACTTASSIDRGSSHFNPESGTTLTDEDAGVDVVGLDGVEVCVSIDGGDPGLGASCAEALGADQRIPLTCGFHTITIRWGEGDKTEQASYLVESPSCAAAEGVVTLWQNDDLVRAFVAVKDALQCEMNGCENPGGVGEWSTTCGDGEVRWNVSLDGVRAISEFTYTNCRATTSIEVHDPEDPYWLNEAAVLPLSVELVLDGKVKQDTDFSGNGDEAGTVEVSGDFEGRVVSAIVIGDKQRSGGWFEAGCLSGPVPGEVCAPGEAMIRYDFPDWSCHGAICPEPGTPPAGVVDTDGDGVADDTDLCPDTFDPYQLDSDADGLGDVCDDEVGFYSIQFQTEGRCLLAESGGDVTTTTSCIATDPAQQWLPFQSGDAIGYRNIALDACLSHTDSWIGPWTLTVATCNGADEFQRWRYEAYDQGGLEVAWPARLHAVSDDFCAYTDFTGSVYGTISNCDLAGSESGRKLGVYAYGDLTGAPLAP